MRFWMGLFFLLFAIHPLHALRVDPSTSRFSAGHQKFRIDTFDFSGEYPQLANIDIDARRNKRVDLLLTGVYPALEEVCYEGSFGVLKGEITGSFPKLTVMNILCSSASMSLDLRGKWENSCAINIRGSTGDISILLPKDVGITVHTKATPLGKVIATSVQQQGWGLINKTFTNDQAETAPVQLTIHVEVTKATITLE